MAGNVYSIGKNRIERGYHPGFRVSEDGALVMLPAEGVHDLYLRAVDSAAPDSDWGRLSFDVACSENVVYYVYAAALNEDSFYRNQKPTRIEDFLCDPEESRPVKKEFLSRVKAVRYAGQSNILLYRLKGRYLYLMIEVLGEGEFCLSNMKVDLQGDNFMNTFPEVYRERNSFFHRFLSVFSSIYEDFQGDIERLPQLLNLDTCPAQLLPEYAAWMGIDVGDNFLDEDTLRVLVKEAYQLNRIKGTKKVLERLAKIVLGEDVRILERNVMADYIGRDQLEEFEKLYGSSVYDVTILINRAITEVQKSHLMFLLNQFKPVRARLHVIQLRQAGVLDSYSYLDVNARVPEQGEGSLDEGIELSAGIQLQ